MVNLLILNTCLRTISSTKFVLTSSLAGDCSSKFTAHYRWGCCEEKFSANGNMYDFTLLSVWNYNKVLKFEEDALVEQWEHPVHQAPQHCKSETKFTLIRHNGSTIMIGVDDLKWWGLKLLKILTIRKVFLLHLVVISRIRN